MEKDHLKTLFEEFKKGNQQRIENYKKFCSGCQNNLSTIPNDYPAFISIGESPVAGIGYANSEVTKACQEKMKNHWQDYVQCMENIKNGVTVEALNEFSETVKEDRGKTLNLFVN